MNTLTLTLVRPLFAMARTDWALWHDGKPVTLAHLDPEALLGKGEVERFVWWTSEQLPATMQDCDPAALLDDYALEFLLQRAPGCTAERRDVSDGMDLRLGCIELELRVTRRVGARLLESLGIEVPVATSAAPAATATASPQVASAAGTTTTAVPEEPKMTRFEERLRLWLAGFGITGDEANLLCAQRRVASCIRDQDEGDLVRELPSALCRVWKVSEEARRRINEPGEMLLLMNFLRQR